MLQNAPSLAIVAVHTDENEPSKVRQLDNWVRHIIGIFSANGSQAHDLEPFPSWNLKDADEEVVVTKTEEQKNLFVTCWECFFLISFPFF